MKVAELFGDTVDGGYKSPADLRAYRMGFGLGKVDRKIDAKLAFKEQTPAFEKGYNAGKASRK
jgi:hypothetical protein